jgi:hypothetical protein
MTAIKWNLLDDEWFRAVECIVDISEKTDSNSLDKHLDESWGEVLI